MPARRGNASQNGAQRVPDTMHFVHGYLTASRQTESPDEQRRLLRQACADIRNSFLREEASLRAAADPGLESLVKTHQHIIEGIEQLARSRFERQAQWRERVIHAMDELVILHLSKPPAAQVAETGTTAGASA